MTVPLRLGKVIGLLKRRQFTYAALFHQVAASVEHLTAINLSGANTLLDVGANRGQFSLAFRNMRPFAQVFAFEPLPDEAGIFDRLFSGDRLVSLERVALAAEDGSARFFVASQLDSSSLLSPGVGQERAFGITKTGTIDVPVRRLDNCVDMTALRHPILLKVDVQGGELGVFDGCDQLEEIDFLYVELSFVELYSDQPLFSTVTSYLWNRGFKVIGVFNQVSTVEFGPTQVDVLFSR